MKTLLIFLAFLKYSESSSGDWLIGRLENQRTIHSLINQMSSSFHARLDIKDPLKSKEGSLIDQVQDEAKWIYEAIQITLNMPSDSDELLRLMGSFTPIFNVSQGCSEASWTLLYHTFLDPDAAWSISCKFSTNCKNDHNYFQQYSSH